MYFAGTNEHEGIYLFACAVLFIELNNIVQHCAQLFKLRWLRWSCCSHLCSCVSCFMLCTTSLSTCCPPFQLQMLYTIACLGLPVPNLDHNRCCASCFLLNSRWMQCVSIEFTRFTCNLHETLAFAHDLQKRAILVQIQVIFLLYFLDFQKNQDFPRFSQI